MIAWPAVVEGGKMVRNLLVVCCRTVCSEMFHFSDTVDLYACCLMIDCAFLRLDGGITVDLCLYFLNRWLVGYACVC